MSHLSKLFKFVSVCLPLRNIFRTNSYFSVNCKSYYTHSLYDNELILQDTIGSLRVSSYCRESRWIISFAELLSYCHVLLCFSHTISFCSSGSLTWFCLSSYVHLVTISKTTSTRSSGWELTSILYCVRITVLMSAFQSSASLLFAAK